MVENKYNIRTAVFDGILKEEERLRKLANSFPKGSLEWNQAWDKLDHVLKRKRAYERAVCASPAASDVFTRRW